MFHFFRVSKILLRQRGRPRFPVEKFLPHGSGKPRRRTLLCFKIFLVSNNFLDKRGGVGGVSRVSIRIFLSQSAEKFESGTVLCCASEVFR